MSMEKNVCEMKNDLQTMPSTHGMLVHCTALEKLSARKHKDDTLVA